MTVLQPARVIAPVPPAPITARLATNEAPSGHCLGLGRRTRPRADGSWHRLPGPPGDRCRIARVGQAFISLLKMMVVLPLVAGVILVGVGSMTDLRTLERVGAATLAFFVITSVAGVLVGMATMHPLPPLASDAARTAIASKPKEMPPLPDPVDFALSLIPASPFAVAADGALLPLGVPSDG